MIEKRIDTNFVFDYSVKSHENTLSAGLLGKIVCIPDDSGDFRPYTEEADDSWDFDGVYDVSYHYLATSCPRFRKCDECPNR